MKALFHGMLMVAFLALAGHHLSSGKYTWVGFNLGFAAFNWKLFTHAWDEMMR
jgi:hypothetical protein